MIYDLAILVQFQLDLIINILIVFASVSLVSIIYSLFNYNPMYSLLFFILSLFNIVIFLFLQNYEFLALLLGLIYFGAILILFFFILLLINLQVVTRDNLHIKRIPLVSIPLIISFYMFIINSHSLGLYISNLKGISFVKLYGNLILTLETLSFSLFTNFSTSIVILGLILFLTLIGLVLVLVSNKTLNLKFLRKSI